VGDLRDEGVTTNFVWVRQETRTNVTILEQGRENAPILINEAGASVSQEEISRFLRRYKRMIGQASWVVLGGSLPPGVPDDFYRELTELAKETGARVAVSAGGSALAQALPACPYLVKPDIRERLAMEGEDLSTREAIITAGKGMVACGVEMIIVSHEFTGDIVITQDAVWEINARVSTTVFKNLVGADDALLGGLIYKLNQDSGLEEALRFGMAAAISSAESRHKTCQDEGKIEAEMAHITLERV
jgi:1-phosphofructokinase family hexose kinase